jgi:hypothetical protein
LYRAVGRRCEIDYRVGDDVKDGDTGEKADQLKYYSSEIGEALMGDGRVWGYTDSSLLRVEEVESFAYAGFAKRAEGRFSRQ